MKLISLILSISFLFILFFCAASKPSSTYALCIGSCGCEFNTGSGRCQVIEDENPCPENFKCETWEAKIHPGVWFICNSRCVPNPVCDPKIPGLGPQDGIITAIGCIPINNPNELIKWFLGKIVFVASGIAFLLMSLGTFQVLTSAGSPEKMKAGSELITSALSGLLFVILSVFLLKLIGVDILQIPGFGK